MSPIAQALEDRFDRVSRSELERLRKKTSGLAPDARDAVHELSVEIVRAIGAQAVAVLAAPDGATLAPVVARLFDLGSE